MSNLVATINSSIFAFLLAKSGSASKADKLPSPPIPPFLQEFFSHNPVFAWLFWLFTALAIGIAALAAVTGNLQKIIDFFQKNLLYKKVEVSEPELLKLRKQLLTRLQSDIAIRRENSLHNLIKIDLEMEEQRHQVGRKTAELAPQDSEHNHNPLNRVFKLWNRDSHQTTDLEPNQKIIEFFDRDDIQGKLLILGEPGAGKTTELISLTQDLIQRAIEDENVPIPIIFELSTWKSDQSIQIWLREQLCDIYKGIPKAVAEKWIENQQIIPLLDGLDELGVKFQNDCINCLNQFIDSRFLPGLVVCCRREEYEQADHQLEQLKGAIYLQPLSDEQIQQYLESLRRSNIWQQTIVNEPDLLDLCRKPLFLTMLVVAYQGRAITNPSELFANYIEKQLNNPENQGTYPPKKSPSSKQTLHYLVWLAKKLEEERETEFLIEAIQPVWLESRKQKIFYRIFFNLIDVLILGLICGLIFGLIGRPIFGLIVGFIGGLKYLDKINCIFVIASITE